MQTVVCAMTSVFSIIVSATIFLAPNMPPLTLFWLAPLLHMVANSKWNDLVVVRFDGNIVAFRLRYGTVPVPYGNNRVPAYGRTRVSLYPSFWNAVAWSAFTYWCFIVILLIQRKEIYLSVHWIPSIRYTIYIGGSCHAPCFCLEELTGLSKQTQKTLLPPTKLLQPTEGTLIRMWRFLLNFVKVW